MSLQLALIAVLALAVGTGLGFVHYRALHAVTRQFIDGRTGAAIGWQLARLALLAGVLVLASWLGALPLLACFGGILIGRWLVLRRVREDA